MRKAAIHLAEAVVAAFTALAAIQPASALPMTNGPVGLTEIQSALEDTGDIVFKTILRVYPVAVSIGVEDLTVLEQPNDPGFGSMAASLNISINSVIFTFRQAENRSDSRAGISDLAELRAGRIWRSPPPPAERGVTSGRRANRPSGRSAEHDFATRQRRVLPAGLRAAYRIKIDLRACKMRRRPSEPLDQ